MPFIDPLSMQLINATEINVPLVQALAEFVNSIYIVFGGLIGISIALLILRWRETYMLRKRMEAVEEALLLINEKLDKVVKKKK